MFCCFHPHFVFDKSVVSLRKTPLKASFAPHVLLKSQVRMKISMSCAWGHRSSIMLHPILVGSEFGEKSEVSVNSQTAQRSQCSIVHIHLFLIPNCDDDMAICRYTSAIFLLKSAIFPWHHVMFRPRSRVLDLETSLARRGAVGGRQRLGETVEDGRHWRIFPLMIWPPKRMISPVKIGIDIWFKLI